MIKDTAKRLREQGINPSMQRIAILNYMETHHTHPTVDNIYNDLFPTMPTLSKTTIYNTLTLFAEHNLILSFMTDDNTAHYDGIMQHHAHFKCTRCGKIYDISLPDIETPQLEGFKINNMKILYSGICEHCNKK